MPHATEGELHAYADGALASYDPDGAARLAAHLEGCADCRARLDEASDLRDRGAELLGAALGEPPAPPGFETLVAEATARRTAVGGSGARSDGRGSTPRLAWAASIVVALGAGWMAHAVIRDTDPDARLEPATAFRAEADGALETEDVAPSTAAASGADESGARRQSAANPEAQDRAPSPSDADARTAEGSMEPRENEAERPATPLRTAEAPPPAESSVQEAESSVQEEIAPAREVVVEESREGAASRDRFADALSKTEALAKTTADDETGWTVITLSEAATEGPVLHVRGLEVVEVAVFGEGAARQLRVRQRLPGGETLELVQIPADLGRAAGLADAPQLSARRDVAQEPEPGATALSTLEESYGSIRVRAAAPVAADSLRALVSRLTSTTPPGGS